MAVQIHHAAGVLTLRLNRPQKLNAVDESSAQELLQALRQADRRDDVRVVVLRGQGRAFCAGRDISEAPTAAMLETVQQVARAIVDCRAPVLAAVHGWVVGVGLEWMLDCDLAIAARGARFRLPEVELGVFATGGVTATLPRAVGLVRARGLLLLGEAFDAAQAERWGLLWSVVDDDALDHETERIAARLASFAPPVVQRFKRVLAEVGRESFEAALMMESRMQGELAAAPPAPHPPPAPQSIVPLPAPAAAPLDLSSSVAGEEDPGASLDQPRY